LDGKESGLVHATTILDGVEGISVCKLTAKDVVRHPLVMRIIRAYEQDATETEDKKKTQKYNRATEKKKIAKPVAQKNREKTAEGE
jgi:phosphate starvation-inducible protein PhoH